MSRNEGEKLRFPARDKTSTEKLTQKALGEFSRHIDLSPATLRDTLEVAMGAGFGYPRLEGPDAKGRMSLAQPIPLKWQALIDDTLRLERKGPSVHSQSSIRPPVFC